MTWLSEHEQSSCLQVNGENREVDLESGLGAVGFGEIDRRKLQLPSSADGVGDQFRGFLGSCLAGLFGNG